MIGSNVLVVGDIHLPAERSDYLKFCRDMRRKYKTKEVVFIGDILDHHAISFHQKNPESDGAVAEYEAAMKALKQWYKAFPDARVCIGNHDERVHRLASSSGIPAMYLREYADIYDTPNWEWEYEHVIDDIYYYHGTGASSGLCPAFNTAKARMQSSVAGHIHSTAGILYTTGPTGEQLFGMNVPNGVDKDHPLMYYSKNFLRKPVNGVGIIKNGTPYLEVM
jgi:predicted phosphodiesterase